MRVFFIILLIALTPLRGWANDVMATRMASQLPTQAQAATPQVQSHCEGMAATDAHAAPAAPVLESLHCDNCALCQMCFAPALPMDTASAPNTSAPHPTPAMQDVLFSSAALSQGHKPPIS
jgi:hypothetical protein